MIYRKSPGVSFHLVTQEYKSMQPLRFWRGIPLQRATSKCCASFPSIQRNSVSSWQTVCFSYGFYLQHLRIIHNLLSVRIAVQYQIIVFKFEKKATVVLLRKILALYSVEQSLALIINGVCYNKLERKREIKESLCTGHVSCSFD